MLTHTLSLWFSLQTLFLGVCHMLYQFESPAARLCVNIKVDQIRNTVIPKTSSFLSAACCAQ